MTEDTLYFKKGQRYMILDAESEGLNLVKDRPFQLSWILCDQYKVIETFDKFIHWKDLNLSSGAREITRFDEDAYKKKAESPEEVYKQFSAHLFDQKNIIVCQNFFNFDCYMIKNLQKLTGNPVDYSYLRRSIDTKILFIAMQKNIKYNGELPFLEWQYKVNDIREKGLKASQIFMLNYFEIPYVKERLHEALYDITMLKEIFFKLLPKFEIPDLTNED